MTSALAPINTPKCHLPHSNTALEWDNSVTPRAVLKLHHHLVLHFILDSIIKYSYNKQTEL